MFNTSFLSSPIQPSAKIEGIKYATFDNSLHDIRALFFDHFDVHSPEQFHSFLLNSSIPWLVEQGHHVIRSDGFKEIFSAFLSDLGSCFGDFAYQALPTFRVQLPGHRSVPFHTDDLSSGHPFDLVNIWLPLTKTNFFNSLHFVPSAVSSSLKSKFLQEKKLITWLDAEARNSSLPWISEYGDIVFFSNSTLHGTFNNDSNDPRVSLDFRIITNTLPGNLNRKKLQIEFVPRDSSHSVVSTPLPATSVVFCANDASHIPHPIQRSLVNNFAQQNGFQIVRETAEWQASHCPIIVDILDTQPTMPILLSTKSAFSSSGSLLPSFQDLLPRLKSHLGGVYFCFESTQIK